MESQIDTFLEELKVQKSVNDDYLSSKLEFDISIPRTYNKSTGKYCKAMKEFKDPYSHLVKRSSKIFTITKKYSDSQLKRKQQILKKRELKQIQKQNDSNAVSLYFVSLKLSNV